MIRNIRKIITPADAILIIFLLIIALLIVVFIKQNISGRQVKINYRNKLVNVLSLNKDKTIFVDEGIIVEIKDGKVRMKASTCKNQYCVKQGWNTQFPIICIPREVAIIILSKNKEDILITR
ncbi:MAG: NusG domain II-containing protein [Candidatus Cloacimonetes bacterium]|nr:NusG domain II-containing protein [Candidatus Cloacimonadota bacterium]